MTFGCFKKHARLTMFHLNIAHKNVKRVKCREFLFNFWRLSSCSPAGWQLSAGYGACPGDGPFYHAESWRSFPPRHSVACRRNFWDRVISGVITGDSLHLRRETWNPKPLIGDKKHVKTPLFPYGIFPAIHWMTLCANANRRQSTFRRQITKDILEALAVPWYHCPWYSIMMMEHQLQMEVLAEIIIYIIINYKCGIFRLSMILLNVQSLKSNLSMIFL